MNYYVLEITIINVLSAEHSNEHGNAKTSEDLQNDMDMLAQTVDVAMKSYDENDDGYIYYGEFYRYT